MSFESSLINLKIKKVVMGKNKRKKKQKQEDFKKVKLRVGRKLPPAPNVTDAQFKSRAIVLPSQLTGQLSDEPTNNRRQNFKDLISQVNHYNSTVRRDALAGLRNLFQGHPNYLQENFGVFIQRVMEKVIDMDDKVRHSLLVLFKYVFPLVTPEKMAPFTPLVLAHLSCAMTHIQEDIQLDSLSLLGLCLQHFPALMASNKGMLLPNFISLILQQSLAPSLDKKNSGHSTRKDSHLNPRGKISSPKSKFVVLKQLLDFLKAAQDTRLVRIGKCDDSFFCKPALVPASESGIISTEPLINFVDSSVTQVQVYQNSAVEPCLKPVFQLSINLSSPGIMSSNSANVSSLSSLGDVKNFIEQFMPLLLESWMNCNPAQMVSGLLENHLSELPLSTMTIVAKIIKLLFHQLRTKSQVSAQNVCKNGEFEWLREKYLGDFKQHFIAFFPFATNSGLDMKGKKKGKKKETQFCKLYSESITLNVLICEVMAVFISQQSFKGTKLDTWVEKLVEFTCETLNGKSGEEVINQHLEVDGVCSLLSFVQQLWYCVQWMEGGSCEVIEDLFASVFHLYQSSHLMSNVKKILLKFFAQTVLVRDQNHRCNSLPRVIYKWLGTLPALLLQLGKSSSEMLNLVIHVIKQSIRQQLMDVNGNTQQSLMNFFDPNKGPFIGLEQSIQRSSVELLFVLPTISETLLKTLVVCCHKGSVAPSVVEYVMQILFYRSPCYSGSISLMPALSLPEYLSFLFSVAVGYSQDELKMTQDRVLEGKRALKFGKSYEVVIVCVDMDKWSYHEKIVKIVCRCYEQINCSDKLLLLMDGALRRLMENTKVFPVIVANSLLMVLQKWILLSQTNPVSSHQTTTDGLQSAKSSLTSLGGLVLASLLTLMDDSALMENDLDASPHSKIRASLGNQALQLLMQVPGIGENILGIVLQELSACTTSTSPIFKDIATVISKLLSAPELRSVFVPVSSEMERIVQSILGLEDLSRTQTVHDLKYQYSLFQLDVKRKGTAKEVK